MNGFITFVVLFIIYIVLNTLYVFYKTGWNMRGFVKYWGYSEGRGSILMSYLRLFFAVMLILIISMVSNNAFSGEWFNGGSVFVGLDTSNEQSVFCKSKGINNTTNSNMGVRQNVYDFNNGVTINGKGTHHSCFANPDSVGYDKLGIELEYKY